MPPVYGFEEVLINLFDFDEYHLFNKIIIDYEVNKHGLYSYEDFKDYLTLEEFNSLPLKYFKIPVENGEISFDDILYLLSLL